jgi:predicted transcriptional regulator
MDERASPSATRVSCDAGSGSAFADGARDNRGVSRPDLRRLRRPEKAEEKFLGPLETEVMVRLWKRRSATVRDIVEDLAKTRELAYTTVMTIMVRLHEKGLLERTREGKTYIYTPSHTRDEHRARLSRDLVRGLVAEFGDAALAAFSAELDTVDSTHRAALRRLAQKDTRETR